MTLFMAFALAVGRSQVAPELTEPTQQEAPCPEFGTDEVSAAASRCSLLAHSGGPLDAGNHLFMSIGSLGGRDTAFNALPGLDATFEGGVLYGGLVSLKPKGFDSFENTASVTNYHAASNPLLYMNTTAISMNRTPTERSIVTFDVNNFFGNDAIRVVDLSGAETDVESASYGIYSGRVLNNQATMRYTRQSTETRWWSVSVRNNFRDFIDDRTQVNTMHAHAEIQFQPSPRAGGGLYEETSIQTGIVDCTSQTAGALYERNFARWMNVEGAAGPAYGSSGCINRLTAHMYGALSAKPKVSTNLWISASRQVNDSQFAALTYENNALGGWSQHFGADTWFKVHGGWIGGTVPSGTKPFQGLFLSSTFGHSIRRGLQASFSMQHFNWSGTDNIAPSRSVFTAALYWSPGWSEHEPNHGPAAH